MAAFEYDPLNALCPAGVWIEGVGESRWERHDGARDETRVVALHVPYLPMADLAEEEQEQQARLPIIMPAEVPVPRPPLPI